jgi:SEC-C motif
VRPTITELYALRHNDVEIVENPRRLLVAIRNGKTGYRTANTMPGAVSVYQRIMRHYPDAKGEDYLFLPAYPNRATASRLIQRQFNDALERANIKHDPFTGTDHTVYSLRRNAICMRIILSVGRNDQCPCGSGKKFKHCCGKTTLH